MNHSIVYSSHTGNTKILAESIKEALPEQDCDYFGGPDVECLDTSLVFVGFWTEREPVTVK